MRTHEMRQPLRWDKTAGGLYTDHSRSPNGDPCRVWLRAATVGGAQGRSLSRLPVPVNVRSAPRGSLTTADISLTVTASYFNRRFECRSPTGSMRGWPSRWSTICVSAA
jgi:hypothetical protein